MKTFLNTCLILLIAFSFCAFDWSPLDKEAMSKKLEEINLQIKTMQNYSILISHASFEDFTSTIPHEKSTGYFKRDGSRFHSFLMGVHTIQNAGCKLVVDSIHHLIYVSDPTSTLENTLSSQDYSILLKTCTSFKKGQVEKQMLYRFEFGKEYPLDAYEMTLSPTGLLDKISIYYNREVKRENNTSTKPRMEITFRNWKKNTVFASDEFDQTKYVEKKGDQYTLGPAYLKNYKLLDQRVLTKKKN